MSKLSRSMVSIIIDNSSLWNRAGGKVVLQPLSTSGVSECGCKFVTLYIYCPVSQEKFMSPSGFFARGRHEFSGLNKSSCLPTNLAINCLFYRKMKENVLSRQHALNRSFACFGLSFSVSETCRTKHILWRHSPSCCSAVPWDMTGRHDVWRETPQFVFPPRNCSRPIIFLYLSYQFYEV